METKEKEVSTDYTSEYWDKREKELRLERRHIPIISGDEYDHQKATAVWLLLGVAGLCVEVVIAYHFFTETMQWALAPSIILSVSIVAAMSLGLKQVLQHSYLEAQHAQAKLREMQMTEIFKKEAPWLIS
jgi:hypothetical protein